jgi:hypothetical protein
MKQRKVITIAAVIGMMAIIQTAQAAFSSGTLGDLVSNNGSLTVGDKTFSNFGYIGSLGAGAALAQQAAGLTVTAVQVSPTLYHLDFAGGLMVNNLGDMFNTLLGDILLSYTVTVNNPLQPIFMIDQAYTPNGLPVQGNQIIIGETVWNGAVSANSTLTLNPLDFVDPTPEAGDNLMLIPPQLLLNVKKDIVISAAPGQLVGLSYVQQSFHEVVPEPTTMIAGALLLLPFGASTLRMLRKKRTA